MKERKPAIEKVADKATLNGTVSGTINALISELHRFHDQEAFDFTGPAIAAKKPLFGVLLKLMERCSGVAFANWAFVMAILMFYRVFRYPAHGHRVFQFGVSANNIRSFDRLNSCLLPLGVSDIATNSRRPSLGERLSALLSLSETWAVAVATSQVTARKPLGHLQTLLGCAAMVMYTRSPISDDVQLVCVASDHAPLCQALLFWARQHKLATCYIQHAPVTDRFPPLNYDLAILYDEASVAAYRRSAERLGKPMSTQTLILSPFVTPFTPPAVREPPYTVGLCLSFLPDLSRIAELLKQLTSMRQIEQVLVRPHPRCHLELTSLLELAKVSPQPTGCSAADFFSLVDIVLGPNSGVLIEALHCGKPTFFTPGTDDVGGDYYGFVRERIVPVFDPKDLGCAEALTSFFDEQWRERYCLYDATAVTAPVDAKNKAGHAVLSLLS